MVSTFLRKVSFADPHIFAGAKFHGLKSLETPSAFSFGKRLCRLSSSGALLFLVGNKFHRNFAYAKQLCCPCSSGFLLRISVGEQGTAKIGGQPFMAGVCFSKLTDWSFPKPFRVRYNLKKVFYSLKAWTKCPCFFILYSFIVYFIIFFYFFNFVFVYKVINM